MFSRNWKTLRTMQPRGSAIGTLLIAGIVLAGTAHGNTIVNGTPSQSGGGIVMTSFEGAESFTLSATETIQGIEFADQEFTPTFNETLNYFIYANSSPFPGALLAQGSNPSLVKSFIVNG